MCNVCAGQGEGALERDDAGTEYERVYTEKW
jgi:hypothetical protein